MLNKIFTCFLSLSFFIISPSNLKSQEDFFGKHLDLEKHGISSKIHYKLINDLNNRNSKELTQKRSNYTHQYDYGIVLEPGQFNILTPVTKQTLIFDDDNLREIFPSWRRVDSTWTPKSYSIYNFNKKGLLTKRTYNLWDGLEEDWSEDNAQVLRFYEYDEENRLIRFYAQDQQDISLNKFNNENIYHYDSLAQLTKIEIYFWADGDSEKKKSREIIYKYNDQSQLFAEINWQFNIDRGWEYDDSTAYYYSNLGLLEKEEGYVWSPDKGFSIITRDFYNYNQNGSFNFIKSYKLYNEEFDFWSSTEFFDYYYHDYGSLDKIITNDSIDHFPYGLVETDIIEYKHDEDVLFENIRLPLSRIEHHFQNHMLLEQTEYYWDDFSYDFFVKHQFKFFYSEIQTSTTEEIIDNSLQIVLSPNPAQDFITLQIDEYSGSLDLNIYNANGMLVYSNTVQSREQVPVSNFDEGIYFYTVLLKGEVKSGKFSVFK